MVERASDEGAAAARVARWWALGLSLLLVAPPALAQTSWHLSADNDYFNFWIAPEERTDLNYAHGVAISVHASGVPHFLERVVSSAWHGPAATDARTVLSLRQEIYLPSSLVIDYPGDRPFAGWLEIAAGVREESATRLRYATLHVGVTGPPSLGEKTQAWVHHAFRFGERDWTHQVPFEPAVAVEYASSSLTTSQGTDDDVHFVIGPAWRVRLGTSVVDASAGVHGALGLRPAPPWREADTPAVSGSSVYLLGAARLDAVAHNVFLDGTLFRDSPSAPTRPFVPEVEFGVGLRFGNVRGEWRVIHRGKEFDRQVEAHSYSTLALSVVGGAPK